MFIKSFNQISSYDLPLVGGKGFALGKMMQAGFPVPDGFVITTDAYKKFNHKTLPASFLEELSNSFEELHTERVAVRSSAVAEDSTTSSWAGQLESYLHVTKDYLITNIISCWDSINSKRATMYAKQQNIAKDKLIVAVVVQKMVNCDAAGVAFTLNPVTNDPNEIIIESCYGLCELLVQGMITPDNFVISKSKLEIVSSYPNDQKIMLTFTDGKQRQVPLPHVARGKPSITTKQVKEIAALAIRLEDHFHAPQDIEWAIEKDKMYIVQSRPITTTF
jgi:phosphoenolpyruvate synthase/pyruvate phosphate dikinase